MTNNGGQTEENQMSQCTKSRIEDTSSRLTSNDFCDSFQNHTTYDFPYYARFCLSKQLCSTLFIQIIRSTRFKSHRKASLTKALCTFSAFYVQDKDLSGQYKTKIYLAIIHRGLLPIHPKRNILTSKYKGRCTDLFPVTCSGPCL